MDTVQELIFALTKMDAQRDRKIKVETTITNESMEECGEVYHRKILGVRLVGNELYIVTTI